MGWNFGFKGNIAHSNFMRIFGYDSGELIDHKNKGILKSFKKIIQVSDIILLKVFKKKSFQKILFHKLLCIFDYYLISSYKFTI